MKEKLTIKLGEDKGIFSMEIEENKAKDIFVKFVNEAIVKNDEKNVSKEELKEDRKENEYKPKENYRKLSEDIEMHNSTVKRFYSRTNNNIKPRLTFYTCTECKKTSYAQAIPTNGEIIKCICGVNNILTDIKKALAVCNCCGNQLRFFVDKNSDFTEIKCRNCEAYIDMKYIEKKDMFVSL